MALLFMDGFDAGDPILKWSSYSASTPSTVTTTRFSTGRALRSNNPGYWLSKEINQSSRVYIGFAYYVSNAGTGDFIQLKADGNNTMHILVGADTNGAVRVWRGTESTLLEASSNGAIPATTWNYIEVSALIDDINGEVVVRVNGNQVIDFTGDTRNGGSSANIDGITILSHVSGVNAYFDDLYICNDTGPAPYNTFLGDVRIHTLTPDAAGTSTQLTPSGGANYETVDELPYSTTDYVYGTPGQKDTYSTSNLPGGTGVIYGVQTNAIVKKTDAGTISGRPVVRAGGTDYPGTSVSVGTSDVTLSKIDQVNPATSTAWTSGDVNGMEIGVESL